MKYYYNLIHKKKFGIIAIMLFVIILGVIQLSIYYNNINNENFISQGKKIFDLLIYKNNMKAILRGQGNLFLGVFLLYLGIIFIPLTTQHAQDPNDYDFKTDENNVYIRFKGYKWEISKYKFTGASSLMFFDKSKKFVGFTRANQVYSFCYNLMSSQCTVLNNLEEKIIETPEKQTVDEKEKIILISFLKLRNKRYFQKLFSLFIIFIGFNCFFISNQVVDITALNIILASLFGVILGTCFIFLGCTLFKNSNLGSERYKQIMNGKVYKTKVYCYSKNEGFHKNKKDFFIKVYDGRNMYFNNLFNVSEEEYQNANSINWYIYFGEDRERIYYYYLINESKMRFTKLH